MVNNLNCQTKTAYLSVCANRLENNLSCYGNFLLYSKSNCLILRDTSKLSKVPLLLAGHKAEINGQRFVSIFDKNEKDQINNQSCCCYIISTSYDKSAIIWQVSEEIANTPLVYKVLFNFKSPTNTEFTSRACLRLENENKFIAITTTLDNLIHLWHDDKLIETVKTNYCCLETKLYSISLEASENRRFILAFFAGTDNIIHIFQVTDTKLVPLLNLTGHNDWTKCIEIYKLPIRKNEFLVASASQDSYIRVWHIKLVDYEIDPNHIRTSISNNFVSTTTLDNTDLKLIATLETVLSGHEAIVTSLSWFNKQSNSNNINLISCSSDKTIVLWQSELAQRTSDSDERSISSCDKGLKNLSLYDNINSATVGIWKELDRFGETGETNLPYLSVCLSSDEKTFYAHSLRGAIHSWRFNEENKKWLSSETITGHFEPVTDLCWQEDGLYLLSVSLDKTCRLHSRIDDKSSNDQNWIELARPNVHGHEINCVTSIGFTSFATGAEEKTIRVYQATQFFINNFLSLTNQKQNKILNSLNLSEYPKHAQLPALGLSIKPSQAPFDIEAIENVKKGDANISFIGATKLIEQLSNIDYLTEQPTEEILLQSTLWWETNKLFGHGNELHALAYASKESFLASASKANRLDLANILIWDSKKMRKLGSIEHHTLTITRLRFSPSNEYLLSVSRDRTWCLSKRNKTSRSAYTKLTGTSKSNAIHDRIIWDCSWTWDEKFFITVSRDKRAIIWSVNDIVQQNETINSITSNLYDSSIQAVDSPTFQTKSISSNSYLFAFGFEDGNVSLVKVLLLGEEIIWVTIKTLTKYHHQPIRRLLFKPNCLEDKNENLTLASASDDCMIKLTEIIIE